MQNVFLFEDLEAAAEVNPAPAPAPTGLDAVAKEGSTYAFSWSGVSVEDGQPLLQGDLDWLPVIEMGKTGKSRNIRQKAGSNDPVTFNVQDFNTNLDTSGTLLSITMRHQMEDDTLSVYNYWENDTVHIDRIHFCLR